MAQETHIVDLRRSFLPIDPNAFPATYHGTDGEDRPEGRIPVIPYDGYNFMPTPQGYASYFGINSHFGINAISASVDDLFVIQTNTFVNIAVALTATGVWTKQLTSSGAWTQEVTLSAPSAGVHKNWSKCVIDQVLYVYRQGEATAWKCSATTGYVFTSFTPSFLTMAGQLGIFKAGGRLGFWDSENSISWSSLIDTADFTPSTQTLAGNTIFQDIVGKIVNVLQHGTGFIIYCTRSIVHVIRDTSSPFLFRGSAIFNQNGISYREEVVMGDPDTQHFAMTTNGFVEIGENGQAQYSMPEISTYLKEKRKPVLLTLLNGRYLCFQMLDEYYFTGRTTFTSESTGGALYDFSSLARAVDSFDGTQSPCRALLGAMVNFTSLYLYNIYGYTAYTQASATGSVPIWQDNLVTCIPLADLEGFKTEYLDATPLDYFNTFNSGAITRLDGSTQYVLPSKNPDTASGFGTHTRVEPNTGDFFHKQDFLWWYEGKFFQYWLEKVKARSLATQTTGGGSPTFSSTAATASPSETNIVTNFGPYIDPGFFSEQNRYYGIADKSVWLQRSLTRGKRIVCTQRRVTQGTSQLARWFPLPNPGVVGWDLSPDGWARSVRGFSNLDGTYRTAVAGDFATIYGYACYASAIIDVNVAGARRVSFTVHRTSDNALLQTVEMYLTWGDTETDAYNNIGGWDIAGEGGNLGAEIYENSSTTTETVRIDTEDVEYPTCTYKELGYTSISGHGHYNIDGSFTVDDSTPEAADYTDICLASPAKRKKPQLNGFYIDYPWNNGALCGREGSVTINSISYSYDELTVTIPSGTILLQQGSIEPIYPTFLGAFVFDIQYKKWGKLQHNYKRLLDIYPLNSQAGDGIVPYDTFLPRGALLASDGFIYIFDQYPTDSELVIGKLGYYRRGYTDLEEVRIQNRTPFSGTVSIEASLNGKNIEPAISAVRTYTSEDDFVAGFNASARWYNVKIEGNYDLIACEVRWHRTGRR